MHWKNYLTPEESGIVNDLEDKIATHMDAADVIRREIRAIKNRSDGRRWRQQAAEGTTEAASTWRERKNRRARELRAAKKAQSCAEVDTWKKAQTSAEIET